MTTDPRAAQDQLRSILAAMQATPYADVDAALKNQMDAVDRWIESVREHAPLVAMGNVVRAQIQATQRMLDVQRREGENVADAMRKAAQAFGVPQA